MIPSRPPGQPQIPTHYLYPVYGAHPSPPCVATQGQLNAPVWFSGGVLGFNPSVQFSQHYNYFGGNATSPQQVNPFANIAAGSGVNITQANRESPGYSLQNTQKEDAAHMTGSFGLIGGTVQMGVPYQNASLSFNQMHSTDVGISAPSIHANVSGAGMNIEQALPMSQTASFGQSGRTVHMGLAYQNADANLNFTQMHQRTAGISAPAIQGTISGSGMNIEHAAAMLQTVNNIQPLGFMARVNARGQNQPILRTLL